MYKITLSGIPPAKKNSKRWIMRGQRKFLIPSQRHYDWHEGASYEIAKESVKIRKQLPLKPILIEILFFCGDKRRRDSTNSAESVMDLLVDVGLIKDDNMQEVPDLRLTYMGTVAKENVRTEINIYL